MLHAYILTYHHSFFNTDEFSFGDCHLTPGQLIQMNTATGAMPHTFTDIPAVKMVRWSINIIVPLFYEVSWPDNTVSPRKRYDSAGRLALSDGVITYHLQHETVLAIHYHLL